MLPSEDFIIWTNVIILLTSMLLSLFYGNDKKLKLIYSVLNIGLLAWLITLFLYYETLYEPDLLLIGRVNFISLNIAMIGFYFFVRIFSSHTQTFKTKWYDYFLLLISLGIVFLTLTSPLVVTAELVKEGGERETVFGDYFWIYILGIVVNMISGAITVVKGYKTADKVKAIQMRIFLVTTVLALTLGSTTNLLLPQFGVFSLQKYGVFALTILNVSMVYLIIRYQFLNVKILLGRVFYYLILIILTLVVFFGLHVLIGEYLATWDNFYKILLASVSAFIFVFVFLKLDDFLQKQVRTRFINPGYDPYEVLEEFNSKIARLLTVDEIKQELLMTIKRTLRPLKEDFIILTNNSSDFSKVFYQLWQNKHLTLISYDTLPQQIKIETFPQNKTLLNQIYMYMKENDWRVINIVTDKDRLVALIFIGKRDMDLIYSQYDFEFISNISHMVGVTIIRSILHQEVQDFNETLKQKVNEQTKELQVKVQELEEARRKEADMIDIMGHELRTPATIVKLNVDLLHNFIEKIPEDRESFTKYVTRIKDAVETEIKLINTLLSSAKLEGDKIEINPEKVDIYKEIDMALHGEERNAQEKNLEIVNLVSEHISPVFADRARTVEILNNLISNAVKYTEKGSVTVKAEEIENFIQISITDTGRGIPQEDISKLGTKFFRTKTYIQSEDLGDDIDIVRPGGTGLGLYVTFNLVKKMGGNISVQSEVGKGSTFTFTLPKYKDQDQLVHTHTSNNMFERLGLKKIAMTFFW